MNAHAARLMPAVDQGLHYTSLAGCPSEEVHVTTSRGFAIPLHHRNGWYYGLPNVWCSYSLLLPSGLVALSTFVNLRESM